MANGGSSNERPPASSLGQLCEDHGWYPLEWTLYRTWPNDVPVVVRVKQRSTLPFGTTPLSVFFIKKSLLFQGVTFYLHTSQETETAKYVIRTKNYNGSLQKAFQQSHSQRGKFW